MYRYYTEGVCPKSILLDIEDDILKEVVFDGGCSGNLIAISSLIQNRNIEEIINTLEHIPCKSKDTSCPDQLAKALKIYLKNKEKIKNKNITPK